MTALIICAPMASSTSCIPWPRLLLLWLAGINLRITLLAIPPLLPFIHRDLSLNEAGVAALLGLPVAMLAVAATLGSMLIARFNARRAAILAIAIFGLSSGLRGIGPSLAMLFAMTFVMGASLAVLQPAMPTLVFHWAPRNVGLATAVYTNGLLTGELIGAGLTSQLILLLAGNWRLALAFWAIFPLATAMVLAGLAPRLQTRQSATSKWRWPDFKHARTWRLGLTQTGTSIIYWGANAFLPDYLRHAGASHLVAPCLFWLNALQVPASLVILPFSDRLAGRAWPIQSMALLSAAGLGLFFFPYDWARLSGAAILGFASAFAFVLILAFPPLLAEDSNEVHRISAGMFTIGYGISSVLPLAGGIAWDRTGIAAIAMAPVAIGVLCLLFGPWRLSAAGRDRLQAAPG